MRNRFRFLRLLWLYGSIEHAHMNWESVIPLPTGIVVALAAMVGMTLAMIRLSSRPLDQRIDRLDDRVREGFAQLWDDLRALVDKRI